MLQSLFSQIQWNGVGLLLALCLTHMIGCGEHATSNCKLQSCTSLDSGNWYLKKKKTPILHSKYWLLSCVPEDMPLNMHTHMSTQKATVLCLVTLVLCFTVSFLRQGDQAQSMQFEGHSPCYICCRAGPWVRPHVWRDQGGAQKEG